MKATPTSSSMITSMDGSLLTNSQEEQLFGELHDMNMNMDDLPFSVSDLQFPDSNNQKFSNSPQFASCSTETVDNKVALHQSLAIMPQYEIRQQQLHQLQHHMQEQDTQQQQSPLQLYQLPLTQTPIPGKEEFAGRYNFQLILNPQESGKQHWIFSEKLSKVFIHMEEVLPLQFQWTPPDDGLWLRATLVFKLDQYRSEPVVRCHNHMAPINASNRDVNQSDLKHVVRCLNNTSIYEENPSNKHLSVLTPLGTPEAGMTHVPVDYKFFCKNSCTHGMNRRATEIIFTLEDDKNVILGRKKLEIRICSCPKRDKDKEELELFPRGSVVSKPSLGKKRKVTQCTNPPPLKKKPTAVDGQVYNINLQIVGQDNVLSVLKYASDVMSGSAIKTDNLELYKPYIDQIQNDIQQRLE